MLLCIAYWITSGGTCLVVPFLVMENLNLQIFIFLMCLNPLRLFFATRIISSLVSGSLFIWLLCPSDMILVFLYSFLLSGFGGDIRSIIFSASEWFCPSYFSKQSFFSENWYLETIIWMFGAFIITGFSLFLRYFQWTEIVNAFFRKSNKILD